MAQESDSTDNIGQNETQADIERTHCELLTSGPLVLDHLSFDVPDGWRVTRWVISDRYGPDHHPVAADLRWP
jgi:hypothetical protein